MGTRIEFVACLGRVDIRVRIYIHVLVTDGMMQKV